MLRPSTFLRTRFAPSPTGRMHLGHAYSALIAWQAASCNPEQFLLRIDDIDHTRCKDEFTDHLIDDLAWLGLSWSAPPIYQSKRSWRYDAALSWLEEQKLVYSCSLSRKEYEASLSAPQETQNNEIAPSPSESQSRVPALRLDMDKALSYVKMTGQSLIWTDYFGTKVEADTQHLGNIILGRRNSPTSYHLSVVLDDADSNIDLVVRGKDLCPSTDLHCLLQALLGLPTPVYYHHDLICDDTGKRLAKRDKARSLATYRQNGVKVDDLLALLPPIGPI